MNLFGDMKTGLRQAIEYEKGNLKARTTILTVEPSESFKPDEICLIQKNAEVTKSMFEKKKESLLRVCQIRKRKYFNS